MTDLTHYRVEADREGGRHFRVVAPNGKELLTTQSVSIQTLVGIAAAHKEGRTYSPERIARERFDSYVNPPEHDTH